MLRNKLFVIGCIFILLMFAYFQYTNYRDNNILSDQTIEEVHDIEVTSGKVK